MPDSLMYEPETHYVILEPDQPDEYYLTTAELLNKLKGTLAKGQVNLPRDLQRFATLEEQAQHLLETYCELELEPGRLLQWYAVRLEK